MRARVLHLVENLDRGAVENWLVRMLRHARVRGIALDWTFYCALGREGALDVEVREMGGHIIHSPVPLGRTRAFMSSLRAELHQGNYEVLHCHHDLVSAIYLTSAVGIPLRKRLVHVHNADEIVPTPNRLKTALLRPLLRSTCLTLGEGIIGISNHTLTTFLAGRRPRSQDCVHYYGIDPLPFLAERPDRKGCRRGLGLPDEARLLLFAGRLVPEKNPLFAIEVHAAMHRRDPRTVLLVAGNGSLEGTMRARTAELGLEDSVRFVGWQPKVAPLMVNSDWFILPRPERPMEGLGIAVVEAQLAGLRLLLSQGIADDPLLPGGVWSRLGLNKGAEAWAEEALRMSDLAPPGAAAMAVVLSRTPFDMDFALRDLLGLHK